MKHMLAFTLSLMLLVASVATGGVNRSGAVENLLQGLPGESPPNGAVVVGARIKIVARSTKVVVSRKSNDQGEYVVDLNPDVYDVEADADGFKKATRKSIPVFGEARSYVDFVLEPKEPFDSRHP